MEGFPDRLISLELRPVSSITMVVTDQAAITLQCNTLVRGARARTRIAKADPAPPTHKPACAGLSPGH